VDTEKLAKAVAQEFAAKHKKQEHKTKKGAPFFRRSAIDSFRVPGVLWAIRKLLLGKQTLWAELFLDSQRGRCRKCRAARVLAWISTDKRPCGRCTLPEVWSANRKLFGFHGGISPVKSACRK
jgi:hypothetical protein